MLFNLSLFHEAHILIITRDDNDNLGTVPVAVITQMAISSAYWATHIVFLIMLLGGHYKNINYVGAIIEPCGILMSTFLSDKYCTYLSTSTSFR